MKIQCKGELFLGSKTEALVWKNKKDSLSVCAFSVDQKADTILLNESFEVKMQLNGQSLVIAS